jgi:4-hydroxy-3-polyprenylbenzoate decarboxylase
LLRNSLPVESQNAFYSAAGGGQLVLILQIRKYSSRDDSTAKQAALMALAQFHMLKHVILVDEDVNIYSHEDLMWAMTTRFQADKDVTVLTNQPGFPMDPSQSPEYSSSIPFPATTTKAIFDCTVPWNMKETFRRTFQN